MLDCAIAESKMRQLIQAPLLSIVVPTDHRSDSLVLAVSSLADQLTHGLEHKVEIIVTDNGSGPEIVAQIKRMAQHYPTVSYLLHKRDEGTLFQVFAAPWRARGEYCWVFEPEDMLLPGGIAHVIETLESQRPSCAVLGRKVFDKDLRREVSASANRASDHRFEAFEDLLAALGVGQLGLVSGVVERTEAARGLEVDRLFASDIALAPVAGLLDKHHGRTAVYAAAPFLVHRIADAEGPEALADVAALALLLDETLRRIGAAPDFFEQMTGERRIQAQGSPAATFVDNIFEDLLRAMAGGRYFGAGRRWILEQILAPCRPGRVQQLGEIWKIQEDLKTLELRAEEATMLVDQGRQACLAASATFAERRAE